DHVEVRERDRARRGVARVRVAVSEHAGVAAPERLLHTLPDDDAAERHIARRDSLGEREEIGLDAVVLRPEPLAEAAETGDHLVEHEQDVVLAAEALDL